MLRSFIVQEKIKLGATVIVLSAFLYFWVNGPVQRGLESLSLVRELTEFSIPKMVGEGASEGRTIRKSGGTIDKAETHGFGHGIMLDRKKEAVHHGVLSASGEGRSLDPSDGRALLARAKSLSETDDLSFELKHTADFFYAQSTDNQLIYLESNLASTAVRGYAGPVMMGAFVHADGHIQSLHHIQSKETESYLRKVKNSGYYTQFEGMSLTNRHTVDAVSGATLTTEAMAATLSELVHMAESDPLENFAGVDAMKPFQAEAELSWIWIVHIIVIGLMFAYGIQRRIQKSKNAIIVLSILSVVYIGFFLNNSFTYVSFIHPFVGTGVSSLVGIYALFTLLGAIWGKNTYCKYVCPFGNVQRLLIQVTPKKARGKFFLSNKWIGRIRNAIALVLIVGVLLGMRNWSNFELFPDLFGLDILSFWFAVALLLVLAAIRWPMIWCRLLCPTGSVLDVIADLSNYKSK